MGNSAEVIGILGNTTFVKCCFEIRQKERSSYRIPEHCVPQLGNQDGAVVSTDLFEARM